MSADTILRRQLDEAGESIARQARTIREQAAEIERLTTALKIANANHEHFERHWYLRGDEIERLRAVLAAARALTGESEEYEFEEGTGRGAANAYWEGLDGTLDAIDAAITITEGAPTTSGATRWCCYCGKARKENSDGKL